MLNNIANSCYGNFCHEDPDHQDSQTWLFEACDNNDNFTPKEKGVLSSLVKKELVIVHEYDEDSTIEFTEAGVEAWKTIKEN
jgi:hypothetical protein